MQTVTVGLPGMLEASHTLAEAAALRAAADGLAAIDVAFAWAEVADSRGWVRPVVDGSLAPDRSRAGHGLTLRAKDAERFAV